MSGARTTTVAMGLLALGAGALTARSLARAPQVERPLPPPPAAVEHLRPPVVDADFRPASRGEAAIAAARVFGMAVVLTPDEAAVGDFNGDGSPDLAVPVRPRRGQAAAVADPLANWTVQDCEASPPAPHPVLAPPSPRPLISETEVLLAMIHGYGSKGWRDPEARQAYVVRTGIDGGWRAEPQTARVSHVPAGLDVRDVLASRVRVGAAVFWRGGAYACRMEEPTSPRPVAHR